MDNQSIGKASAFLTGVSVLAFAASLIAGFFCDSLFACCFSSMLIALGFVPFMAALNACNSNPSHRACSIAAMCFATVYAVLVFLVYYAQCTSVRLNSGLSEEALSLISYGHLGSLFFNYDLLGYAFMALSTFLTGCILPSVDRSSRILKALLMLHGIFFISCFLVPLFPVFTPNTNSTVGSLLLLAWCAYFLPICVIGFRYFDHASFATKQ